MTIWFPLVSISNVGPRADGGADMVARPLMPTVGRDPERIGADKGPLRREWIELGIGFCGILSDDEVFHIPACKG